MKYDVFISYRREGGRDTARLILKSLQNLGYWVGYCYEHGQGVNKNYNEAIKWYRKAAAQGLDSSKEALKRLEKL